jgi:hypothetical protein
MTSIEFLFNELWETPKDKLTWHTIFNKAKEMHKQEIEISDEQILTEATNRYVIEDEIEAFIQGANFIQEKLKI